MPYSVIGGGGVVLLLSEDTSILRADDGGNKNREGKSICNGRGGEGYGAGGGAGGWTVEDGHMAGGAGAPGLIYIEWDVDPKAAPVAPAVVPPKEEKTDPILITQADIDRDAIDYEDPEDDEEGDEDEEDEEATTPATA